ncbi:MAG: hypothetical protein QXN01_04875 [Candidatus Anstonellales archaeon]
MGEIEEKLRQIYGDSFEEKVQETIAKYEGLLTREVAIKLIAKENGLIKDEPKKISEIKPGAKKVWLRAYVKEVEPTRVFGDKKMRAVVFKDETGEVKVKFWNDQIDMLKKIKIGDLVEIKYAYEKNGLSLSYGAEINVVEEAKLTPLALMEEGKVSLKEVVDSVEGKMQTRKGEFFVFYITDGERKEKCIIVEGIDRGEKIKPGEEVLIQNATYKNEAVWINSKTRLLVKRKVAKGIVEDMFIHDDKLVVVFKENGKRVLERKDALKFLEAEVSDDISLETILNLKKENIIGKEVIIP